MEQLKGRACNKLLQSLTINKLNFFNFLHTVTPYGILFHVHIHILSYNKQNKIFLHCTYPISFLMNLFLFFAPNLCVSFGHV